MSDEIEDVSAERQLRKAQSQALLLGDALEDALAELYQIKGADFLEVFRERRIRRTITPIARGIEAATSQLPEPTRQLHADLNSERQVDMLAALERVIGNVRRDPTPSV